MRNPSAPRESGVFMKLLKRLIINLIALIGLIVIALVIGYVYVRKTYNIDLFNTVSQLKTLSKEVDEKDLHLVPVTDNDLADAKAEVDKSIENYITYEEGTGYNGYTVNLDKNDLKMNKFIALSEAQLGMIGQTILQQQTGGKISIGGKEVGINLRELRIQNVQDDGSTDLTVIVELDLKPLFDEMKKFPLNFLKKYAPKKLYILSTVTITKGETAFSYEVSHKSISINNLKPEETVDFFNTLNFVFKIGTATDLNLLIGNTFANVLLGNETNPGFGYSLKQLGAKDFLFATLADTNFFIIQK